VESAWDLKAYVREKLTTIAELLPLPQGPRYADRKKKNTHLEEQFG